MIEIKDLSFGYKKKSLIYENFSLNIGRGEVFGLLGKNGTGKTTLLYLLTGLLHPQKGKVLFNGTDVHERRPGTLSEIFIVPEEFELPDISLKQYVNITAPFYPKFSHEQLDSCLKVFDMPADIKFGELSMGQKKKAFICFALATNTRLLVMDEPSNGLDIPSKSQFRKAIAMGMSDEKSVIISTHQVRDIDSLLDHVIIIDDKKVLLDATTTLINERLYFGESEARESDEIIYTQPSIGGNSLLRANRGGEDSNINLELLFNATLAEREKIAAIFNK